MMWFLCLGKHVKSNSTPSSPDIWIRDSLSKTISSHRNAYLFLTENLFLSQCRLTGFIPENVDLLTALSKWMFIAPGCQKSLALWKFLLIRSQFWIFFLFCFVAFLLHSSRGSGPFFQFSFKYDPHKYGFTRHTRRPQVRIQFFVW